METVTLNNTHPMPTLGLGVYMVTDEDDCERAVEAAIRAGYRLIDTAAAYRNERAVGRGIITSGVPREDIFVTSKIWVSDFGYDATKKAVARSLERLGTGYIDLLLLHQPFGDVLGSWKALEESVAAGTVRSIGVSNFLISDLEKLLAVATIVPAVNQVERHPYYQQKDLTPFLQANGIVPEAWYPLGHGAKALLAEPVFAGIASKYSKDPAQVILRWQVQSGYVAIPKSTNPHHIAQNLDIYDFALTDDEMLQVRGLDRNRPSFRAPRWLFGPLLRMIPLRQEA